MARLPKPGGDSGSWGDILNDYLAQAHNSDGSIKDTGVVAAKYTLPAGGIPKSDLAAAVQTTLDNADTIAASAVVSVAGRTGVVTLAESDITNLTSDLAAKYMLPIGGIPKSDLTAAVQASLDSADSALQVAPVTSVAGRTGAITLAESDVTNLVTDLSAKYVRPGSGIPKADLSTAVQTSLDNADSALQVAPVTSVAGRTGAITIGQADVTNLTTDLATKVSTTAGGKETFFDIGNSGSSKQIDLANGNHQSITLTANCTLTATGFTNAVSCSILLEVIQDSSGGHTLTLPAGWSLPTDGEATINPAINGKTLISALSRDGGTTVYASIAGWWT